MQFSEIKKTVINVLTVVVTAGPWVLDAMNVFPGGTVAATFVSSILGVAGVVLHYLVPNTTNDPEKAKTQSMAYKPDAGAKVAKTSRKRKASAVTAAAAHPHPLPKVTGAHEKPDDPPAAKPVM